MVDRSLCARPVVREGRVSPCARPATVVAPEDSGFTWAYCLDHATQLVWFLELEIAQDMETRRLAPGLRHCLEAEADKRHCLDALRVAIELS